MTSRYVAGWTLFTHEALTFGFAKKRPKRLPKEARFNRTEGHWEIEPRDSRRRAHGLVTFFRPDGSLEATAHFEHGVIQGPYVRYHESGEDSVRGAFERGKEHGTTVYLRSSEPTSELAFEELGEAVVKMEYDFIHGCVRTSRWFDAKGRLVTPEGERWPPRPKGVSAD